MKKQYVQPDLEVVPQDGLQLAPDRGNEKLPTDLDTTTSTPLRQEQKRQAHIFGHRRAMFWLMVLLAVLIAVVIAVAVVAGVEGSRQHTQHQGKSHARL